MLQHQMESHMQNSHLVLHRSADRGYADHGWLRSWHSFSFASYYNPQSMHFGVLRVLNDDIVQGGGGFGKHPHDNMEIITIPFHGKLEHADSMGHTEVIGAGEVQVMSAGSGLMHSEYNQSQTEEVNLAQIWLYPNKRNVEPRYDQKAFDANASVNTLQLLVSPDGEANSLWIHQNAWVYRGKLDAAKTISYSPRREGNGSYVFVVEGSVQVNGTELSRRDAIGFGADASIDIIALSDAQILFFDVPMTMA